MKRLTEFRRWTLRAGKDNWLFLNRFGTGPIHADKALERLQSAAKRVGMRVSLKAAKDRLGQMHMQP